MDEVKLQDRRIIGKYLIGNSRDFRKRGIRSRSCVQPGGRRSLEKGRGSLKKINDSSPTCIYVDERV